MAKHTHYYLSLEGAPPQSEKQEEAVHIGQLPTAGCCSSKGELPHFPQAMIPLFLFQVWLPATGWRWRKWTTPESKLWVRE